MCVGGGGRGGGGLLSENSNTAAEVRYDASAKHMFMGSRIQPVILLDTTVLSGSRRSFAVNCPLLSGCNIK